MTAVFQTKLPNLVVNSMFFMSIGTSVYSKLFEYSTKAF